MATPVAISTVGTELYAKAVAKARKRRITVDAMSDLLVLQRLSVRIGDRQPLFAIGLSDDKMVEIGENKNKGAFNTPAMLLNAVVGGVMVYLSLPNGELFPWHPSTMAAAVTPTLLPCAHACMFLAFVH